MELNDIRKQLDKLDQSLDYIILLRMSLTVLVGEVKKEKKLPLFQPIREQSIYNEQKLFAKNTGLDEQLLIQIFNNLIKNALKIEENISLSDNIERQNDKINIKSSLDGVNKVIDSFLDLMNDVNQTLIKKDIKSIDYFKEISNYYKNYLNSIK